MHRTALLLLIATVISAPGRAALSLADAFTELEKANPSVLIGREAVAQAVAQAEQQRAGLLPDISLSAQQRRMQTVQFVNDVPVVQQPMDRFDGRVVGSAPILNFSQLQAYKAAKTGAVVAGLDADQTVQAVLNVVGQAYFTHLRNLQRIQVLDANATRARELLDLVRRQLDAGVVTQIDVTRAESQLAIAEQARLQQDTTVFQSELALKRLLDRDISQPLELTMFKVARVDQAALGAEVEKDTLNRRSDYLRATKAVEQNKQQAKAAGYQRLGELSLIGEYGYTSSKAFDGEAKPAWLGGVALSLPVFDGFRIGADKRVALSQLRQQELRVRALELQIPAEVRLAAQDARSRFTQVGVAERSYSLAQEQLRLAKIRFEGGAVDNREVIDAQNNLAEASDNLLEAVFRYALSRLELARSKGDVRGILAEETK